MQNCYISKKLVITNFEIISSETMHLSIRNSNWVSYWPALKVDLHFYRATEALES